MTGQGGALGSIGSVGQECIATRGNHRIAPGESGSIIRQVYFNQMRSKHKITTFVPDILLLEHWNRRFESFPTMYRSGGCP